MMRERLSKKRILLVLDDVDNLDQIETLIGEKPSFGHGSRIIITTRDKKLLGGCKIYEPELLTDEEALELFSKYAFRTNKRSENYDAMSRCALKYAYGLPLALKVLGCLLDNRSELEWKFELEKIKEIPVTSLDDKIRRVLWASYDGLDEYQKNIFLDIACFFKGKNKDFVTKFHKSCGYHPQNGLTVLVERSLVSVNFANYDSLEMHDLIQEVGRDIVHRQSTEDPGMRSRLWSYEDVHQVLAQNTATKVEGIILDLSKFKEVYVNDEVFVSMRRLRLLQLYEYYYKYEDEYEYDYGSARNEFAYRELTRPADYEPCVQKVSENLKFLSQELRILVWHGCPLKSFPINFLPKNLIYVDMCYSRIEQLWEGTGPLQHLVHIDLRYSKYLIKTPDFTGATNLKKLKLKGCTSLLEVHPSISALKSLVELDLRGCSNLKKFPNISGIMKKLEALYLDETAITEMPLSINDLSGLQTLSLAGCRELRSLPSSIHMKSLKYLVLSGCSKLTEFPEISEVMKKLWKLELDGTTIKELPSSINNLTGLWELSLTNCTSLVCLPDHICNLASLNLTGCSSLVCLPDNICNLARHSHLNLTGCSSLVCLPDNICNLACLSHLNLTGCSSLVCLPDNICNLARLSHLNLTGCSSLVCLPDNIFNLARLSQLNLTECSNLSNWPEYIGNLKPLWQFEVGRSGIKQLTFSILRLGDSLSLSCNGCKEMTAPFSSLPTWNHQNQRNSFLESLDLSDCNLLELSYGIAHLLSDGIAHLSLYELNLSGNNKLESLPAAMIRLGHLRRLYLRGCKRLKSIPELSSSIQEIDAQDCASLETVSTPQPPYAEDIRFRFVNCFKLVTNTNLFIDIVETATDIQVIYDRYIGPPYHVSLPGSDIPEWFNHQSRGSSVTVQLPPNWLANKFLGFAICAIGNLRGAANTKTQSAVCCCTLEANDGQDNFYFSLFDILDGTGMPLESDHMLLGYTNLRSLGERHNERKYTEARFRIVASTYGVIPNDSMTLEDCTWITSCGVRLFHINPPSVDLICNLENRETEIRSKRKRETLERGKEKMGVEVQEEGEECSGGPICCCFSLSGCTISLRKRQKEKEREGEGVAGDTGLESEDADVSGEGGLLTLC
ncbi:putative winged helix-turn-helix DNA-binding domain, leucine-rich repeat domain, L [Rosa chinensis]|uniref:ADP-ribosyl cyclase/cyclic ADP-ribose hydrolase n=1 Tax=Rosa chinensis TaxID=74649 RepID=A0A2P6SFT7_ROSCH|nr:putative winged helix-turn-helix DNA-binding domain, leucine-rich repeat domain, L [Rosa chinensis]